MPRTDAFDLAAGFFLGRIVEDDPNDLVVGDTLGGPADDGTPELPSSVIEGATEEDIESGKVLDGGGAGEPEIGGDGVTVSGQSPATGQIGEGLPRRSGKETLKQVHQKGSK